MINKAKSAIANARHRRALPKGRAMSAAALRLALFSSVAAGSLMLAGPPALADSCVLSGTTVTCTGNVSSGIYYTDPVITLTVDDVTSDISPAYSSGINLQTTDYIHANVDLGGHKINVTGGGTDGIVLNAAGDDRSVDLIFTGDITATKGNGIILDGWGGSSVVSTGDISAKKDAINVHAAISGKAQAVVSGDLVSTTGYGVRADGPGSVAVSVSGSVTSYLDGVRATATGEGSDGTVRVTGDATINASNGYGIYADSSFHSVVVDYDGDVSGALGGIAAFAHGDNDDSSATVISSGDVTSSGGIGIQVDSSFHAATVTSTGDVNAKGDAINARTHGSADDASTTVDQTGDVTSQSGSGIVAVSDWHTATIRSSGDVTAYVDGLVAQSHGDGADAFTSITSVGDVTATTGYGINALSDNQYANVNSTGRVEAQRDAIRVVSHGDSLNATANAVQKGDVISHAGSGIVVLSDTQSATINLEGNVTAQVSGLVAQSHGDGGHAAVSILSDGNITATTGYGIYAVTDDDAVRVDSTGIIAAQLDGIYVRANGDFSKASAIVLQDGNVTSYGGSGITAESDVHMVSISSEGDIVAYKDGVVGIAHGEADDALVRINSTGDVTAATGYGIYAQSDNHLASVTSSGDVDAYGDAISAIAKGGYSDSQAQVYSVGDITSHNGRGLVAISANFGAAIQSEGDVTAKGDAIVATSNGSSGPAIARVWQEGDVTSETGYGIYAKSASQFVMVNVTGDVEAAKDAIYAVSTGSADAAVVSINYDGAVTSHSGNGIYAVSANHTVGIEGSGAIDAYLTGVYARSTGNGEDAVVRLLLDGNITSRTDLGIYAESVRRGVIIDSTGDILAADGGITAKSTGDDETATVHVTHEGTIDVEDGSGIYGYASNHEVSITQTGDVTGGDYGLYAKSEGGSVDITLEDGTVSGNDIAAIKIESITGNLFVNHGTVEGGDGLAISAQGWGGSTIKNYGTVTGDVEVDDDWGDFINYASGVYNITSLDFQNGGLLTNNGTLSAGGMSNIAVATVTGSLVQETGTLLVDIDGDTADRIDVSGSASMDGSVRLNFENIAGEHSYTIVTSSGLLTQSLSLAAGTTIIAQDSTFDYVDGTDVVLNVKLSYALEGVAPSNTGLAQALQNAFVDGTTGLGDVLAALANSGTIEEYNAALEQLAGENYTQDTSSIRLANTAFTDRLFSCKVQDGAYMYSAEGECSWFSMAAGSFDRSSDIAGFDYSQDSQQIALGGQIALDADWRLGGAFGFTQYQGSNGLGATKDGAQYEAGGVLKYDHEGTVLSTAVSLGTMTADSVRHVDFGGLDEVLTGRATGSFGSLRFQASHTFDYGDFYLKPMADLNFTQVHQDEFVEQGGDAALDIEAHNQLITTLDPSLEIGGQVKVSESAVLRPYVRAGISVISGGDGEMTASFVEGEGSTFTISNSDDKLLGKVSAGADLLGLGEANFRLYYEGSFGETTKRQTVGLKIGMPF